MKHYIEIKISGRKNRSIPLVMGEVLNDLHNRIVRTENVGNIAVSFPFFGENLGSALRVHGSESDLIALDLSNVDDRQIKIGNIDEAPKNCGYASFGRVRPSKQNSKLVSGIKSGHIKDRMKYVRSMCQEILDNPYFIAQSGSTNKTYKRFINRVWQDKCDSGEFDSFGMSKINTVPIF